MGFGEPEDLTGAVVLLCSQAGRFITGTDVKVDGAVAVRSLRRLELTLFFLFRGLYDVLNTIALDYGFLFGYVGWGCGL